MSDTLSKAILKGHKKKYPVNDYKRTKKYNNLEDLPTKESITYGRDSYDLWSTTYKYALIKRFLNGMVGKHIDEVYSKYKQTVINASHSHSLNNPFYYSQFEKEYYFHNFIIDENGFLKREQKEKINRYPYFISNYSSEIRSRNYFSSDYIYVLFKNKEYVHNGYAWHEYIKADSCFYYIFEDKRGRRYGQFDGKIFAHKLRTLSNKEIKTLNLNPLLDMPFKLFKLPDNYK